MLMINVGTPIRFILESFCVSESLQPLMGDRTRSPFYSFSQQPHSLLPLCGRYGWQLNTHTLTLSETSKIQTHSVDSDSCCLFPIRFSPHVLRITSRCLTHLISNFNPSAQNTHSKSAIRKIRRSLRILFIQVWLRIQYWCPVVGCGIDNGSHSSVTRSVYHDRCADDPHVRQSAVRVHLIRYRVPSTAPDNRL